jgi:hypothetical protein
MLQFQTISLELILGVQQNRTVTIPNMGNNRTQSILSRTKGIALRSSSGEEVVGSLHPDNFTDLPESGARIECLVLSRSQTPTLSSALLQVPYVTGKEQRPNPLEDENRPWDLFWIMYVVWKGSTAERRGIGQILTSALEKAVAPGPELKDVVLG